MKFQIPAMAFTCAVLAHAHFVYVAPEAGGATARIFMSETLTPDLDVGLIAGTKLTVRDARGVETPLVLSKTGGNFFSAALSGAGTRVIHGISDVGVMTRGGKSHVLIYYPKSIVGDPFDEKTRLGDAVPVEIVPMGREGSLKLRLVARGKPKPNSEMVVILPDGSEKKLTTDANGETESMAATGRYGAWARHWEKTPGERGGKAYEEVRHYATLVIDVGKADRSGAGSNKASVFARLPQATASFGAVASDGWLYVYGGHVSPTHSYFKEAVSGRFDRVRLSGQPVWESLPEGPAMQGMNLAAHDGKIYRVGGMEPRNERGEPADIHSIADAARFDTASGKWELLPPLPEPRSSHDVAVVDNKLIVIGGWTLAGKSEQWIRTVAILDLAEAKPTWRSVAQPFARRALMAVAVDGKVYVIGGMNEKQQVERKVSIYDPRADRWADGPALPPGANLGFAPAAGMHQGRLHVSLADGRLLSLAPGGGTWEKAGESTPRVAHRLASRGNSILLIGGAAKGKNFDLIESIEVE